MLSEMGIEQSIIDELIPLITSRMAPQAKKVRADLEVTCFSIHGVDGIRAAIVTKSLVMTSSKLQKRWERRICPYL